MEISFTAQDLAHKKLMIATPMYGGNSTGPYTKSLSELSMIAGRLGIAVQFYFMYNESLITRARNYCVDEFMRSDCTHLMFIDSDISFDFKDVLTLLYLCDETNDYDIICGPYPKKTIAWEKVKKAVDLGYGDNPFMLENFVGDYVFNLTGEQTEFRIDEPVQVRESGTGFMMIKRSVFEKYQEAFPEYRYRPDHARTAEFDGSREIVAFFDCVIDKNRSQSELEAILDAVLKIDPKADNNELTMQELKDKVKDIREREAKASKRYLSEDYMFCQNARKIGLKVWLCPWMELKHTGTYTFGGSMAALAAINASPTATDESKSKNYLNPEVNPAIMNKLNRHQRRKQKKGK